MKIKSSIVLVLITTATIMACHTTKKTTTLPPPLPEVSKANPTPAAARPGSGIYEPGQEEVTALQARYQDVTLEQLKEGHLIYTLGACIQCHKAMNIYQRNEAQWEIVLNDMAKRARISAAQKDAVYKYILAVKAVKAKENR